MREDLLHFIWKTNKLSNKELLTTSKQKLTIKQAGFHNYSSGPDFFNAQIEIENQLWAGNVEIHIKSSDWYVHGHEVDAAYDNVILHVVWEDDISVFRKDKSEIPSLELRELVSKPLLEYYKGLFENSTKKFINCENDFNLTNDFVLNSWLDRLYFERLEQKSILIFEMLKKSNNDWESVLFSMLLKSFGTKVNGASFLSITKALDFSVVRKLYHNSNVLESVLFGVTGLLDIDMQNDANFVTFKKEYLFQKAKFQINTKSVLKPEFYGLRPNNFPTIRLSQFAMLYASTKNLFSKVITLSNKEALYNIFNVSVSAYWINHFSFGKESKPSKKALTKSFINLLIINTLLPLRYAYAKSLGKEPNDDTLLPLLKNIAVEKNNIIKKYDTIGRKTKNAFESQAKLQLFNEYCSKNKCLQCAVGVSLLNQNS